MKLLSFLHKGRATFGALNQHGDIIDLSTHFQNRISDLRDLLEQQELKEAASYLETATDTIDCGDVEYLPVIPNPGKIVCVGLNYYEHVVETGREVTQAPTVFLRVAESQVGHDQSIVVPYESNKLDFEGEIAVVIGKKGRRIKENAAFDYIAGYSCYNDGSVRDWQKATTQWTPGKNFVRTGGFGPYLVTADEFSPATPLTLVTRLNGVEVQRADTTQLIHSIPKLLAYVSTFLTLTPGDVIVTGTPGGVGVSRTPPLWMKAGDTVEVEVSGVGILRNTIASE